MATLLSLAIFQGNLMSRKILACGKTLACTDPEFSINFPALASVYGDITIIGPSGQSADSTEYPSLNITFPVLEGSRGLNISGNISRFRLLRMLRVPC